MGTVFDQKERFLGVSLTTYRDVLRRWASYRDVEGVVSNRKIGLSPQAAAVLINEADLAGFFEPGDLDNPKFLLSDRGRGFVWASPLSPIKRERATEIIAEIVANCGMVNRRDDLCFHIDRVWLFGSYVQNAPTVNDIDIVIEVDRIPGRSLMDQSWEDRMIELACDMGGRYSVYRSFAHAGNAERYLERRLIFGRANPRISRTDVRTLKALACECQLVFDRSRGGPVNDQVLPKHPKAGKRASTIFNKAVMPDLRPSSTQALVKVNFSYFPAWGFVTIDDAGVNLRLVETDLSQISDLKFSEWSASLGKVDGRSRSVVVYCPEGRHIMNVPPVGLAFDRAITTEDDAIHYSLNLSEVHLGGRRVFPSNAAASVAAAVLVTIGSDLEAISMKNIDSAPKILIELAGEHQLTKRVRRLVEAELQHGLALPPQSFKAGWLSPSIRERISAGDMRINTVVRKPKSVGMSM